LLSGDPPEKIVRLFPVIILKAVVIAIRIAFERERLLSRFRLIVLQSLTIRVIGRRRFQVYIAAHLPITVT
jgi:hypothetical protein